MAISSDGRGWFLLNASPDVRDQVARLNGRTPDATRHVPVEGIVTTDAELDHTLGLALLREAGLLQLFATFAVADVLSEDSRLLPVTEAFAEVRLTRLPLDHPVALVKRDGSPAGAEVTAFAVAGDPPRFARRNDPGHTVGLQVRDTASGGRLVYVPGCGAIDPAVRTRLGQADLLLFDGTFWADDEMIRLGISRRTARELDHLPVSGAGGSLEQLATLPCRHRVYTHINNSNPMLIEDGPERQAVHAAGIVVGEDGMRFTL